MFLFLRRIHSFGTLFACAMPQPIREKEMKILRTAAYILLFTCLSRNAQLCYAEANQGWKKKWILATAALIASNVLDAYSSRGGHEMNPLLRGPDGNFSSRKAVVVKSAASGGVLLLQVILIKKMPNQNLYRPFAITTAAAAGFTAVTAARNYTVQPRKKPAYLLRQGVD